MTTRENPTIIVEQEERRAGQKRNHTEKEPRSDTFQHQVVKGDKDTQVDILP